MTAVRYHLESRAFRQQPVRTSAGGDVCRVALTDKQEDGSADILNLRHDEIDARAAADHRADGWRHGRRGDRGTSTQSTREITDFETAEHGPAANPVRDPDETRRK